VPWERERTRSKSRRPTPTPARTRTSGPSTPPRRIQASTVPTPAGACRASARDRDLDAGVVDDRSEDPLSAYRVGRLREVDAVEDRTKPPPDRHARRLPSRVDGDRRGRRRVVEEAAVRDR